MWGPVNGETAALGWSRSHLKRVEKKKLWTHRQSQTGSFMLLFPPFLSPFPILNFSFPLNHFHFVSSSTVLFPSSLRHFLPISSSQVELCLTGLFFMPCTVQWVACQALRVQGCSPGTDALAGAQASVACALVSWQSS